MGMCRNPSIHVYVYVYAYVYLHYFALSVSLSLAVSVSVSLSVGLVSLPVCLYVCLRYENHTRTYTKYRGRMYTSGDA